MLILDRINWTRNTYGSNGSSSLIFYINSTLKDSYLSSATYHQTKGSHRIR